MTPWTLLRALPRIADTLLDLVHLAQETNLLLRELFWAQTSRRAQTASAQLITTRRPPLDRDADQRAASRRPPARGDQVWRMTRSKLEDQARELEKLASDREAAEALAKESTSKLAKLESSIALDPKPSLWRVSLAMILGIASIWATFMHISAHGLSPKFIEQVPGSRDLWLFGLTIAGYCFAALAVVQMFRGAFRRIYTTADCPSCKTAVTAKNMAFGLKCPTCGMVFRRGVAITGTVISILFLLGAGALAAVVLLGNTPPLV